MSMREPSDPVLNRDQTVRSGCADGYPADAIASLAPIQRPVAESATAVPLWPVEQVICTSRIVYGHSLDGLDKGITTTTSMRISFDAEHLSSLATCCWVSVPSRRSR